tara:strand:+ start:179 stop:301 length:123 start_codon:yes stop_codon:yes gene_type:complete
MVATIERVSAIVVLCCVEFVEECFVLSNQIFNEKIVLYEQ